MRGFIKVGICALVAFVAGLSLVSGLPAETTTAADVAIVVNRDNNVNNLTMPELRKIFRGERQYWRSDSPIVLLMHAPGARERAVILRSVLQMSEDEYTQFWVAKIMRAEASFPPTAVFSYAMIGEGIRGNPGAIGYVSANAVPVGLKILQVDGLLPGQAGYPLH